MNWQTMKKSELIHALEVYERQNNTIIDSDDVKRHLEPYVTKRQEHMLVLTLDGAHHAIKCHVVSIGLANKSLVHPREIFTPALQDNAVAVIVAHNHPSGALEPSAEDVRVTKQLSSAGEVMGIKVLDHIVFSVTGFYSMRANGIGFE